MDTTYRPQLFLKEIKLASLVSTLCYSVIQLFLQQARACQFETETKHLPAFRKQKKLQYQSSISRLMKDLDLSFSIDLVIACVLMMGKFFDCRLSERNKQTKTTPQSIRDPIFRIYRSVHKHFFSNFVTLHALSLLCILMKKV